jgi:hypothetical protein
MGGAQRSGSPEETAASYLRGAASRAVPGPIALARVRRRLDASLARAGGSSWRWKTILAVFALGMSLGGATAAAIWGGLPWKIDRAPAPPSPAPAIERSHRARAHAPEPMKPVETRAPGETLAPGGGPARLRPIAPPALIARAAVPPASGVIGSPPHPRRAPEAEAPSSPAGPAVAPPPAPPPSSIAIASSPQNDRPASNASRAAPGLARIASSTAPAVPAASPAPASGDLAEEARLLGLALRQLHRDHDPRASLKTLDDHAARFPHTTLKPEADVTRVEALLALDRRAEALVVLDGMSIPATARGRSLAVARGELRATAQRCSEAIPDFSLALEAPAADALAEKALHGRIACLVVIGENGGARTDARTYLERFPSGRFAPEVRRLLGGAGQR